MSTPYAGPSTYPTLPPAPVKKRPRAWWFVLGGVLMLAALVVFVVAIANFVHLVAHSDAKFWDAGRHQVTVPAHGERGLYVIEDVPRPTCRLTDGTGAAIRLVAPRDPTNLGGWRQVAIFDTGDGQLTFRCGGGPATLSQVRIAAVPKDSDFARLGVLGIGLPLLLGGTGFLVVLVTGILWSTRRTPRPGPPYGPSPGGPYATPGGYPPGPPPQG